MPGTHLLPPNLLKLFAPRPPLAYARPIGKDIDRISSKDVGGVGQLLAQLKEITNENQLNGEGDGTEEGGRGGWEAVCTKTKREARSGRTYKTIGRTDVQCLPGGGTSTRPHSA